MLDNLISLTASEKLNLNGQRFNYAGVIDRYRAILQGSDLRTDVQLTVAIDEILEHEY